MQAALRCSGCLRSSPSLSTSHALDFAPHLLCTGLVATFQNSFLELLGPSV